MPTPTGIEVLDRSKEVSEVIREALCLHEAFRRLGFPSEDIYVLGPQAGRIGVAVQKTGKSFAVEVGQQCHLSDEAFEKLWDRAVVWFNEEASEDELQEMWENSKVLKNSTLLVSELQARGFPLSLEWY
jgi:hypothetical protein